MGIQQAAFVRKVRIRYSFPQEHPSTGGKDDGARRLYEYPIKANKTSHRQLEQNTRSNAANRLLITVHCNMAGSSDDPKEDGRQRTDKRERHRMNAKQGYENGGRHDVNARQRHDVNGRRRQVAATARHISRQASLAVTAGLPRLRFTTRRLIIPCRALSSSHLNSIVFPSHQ